MNNTEIVWKTNQYKCPKCGSECENGYQGFLEDYPDEPKLKYDRCKKGCFTIDMDEVG